ncbi:MAG: GNAT family N-acetyltransferase [Limnochordales bacterium]|nr:GNAT family N-acetyltransferase [Limnochordales bacterium]
MQPDRELQSGRVRLRPLRKEDLLVRLAMNNDPEVQRRTLGDEVGDDASLADMENWFHALSADQHAELWAVEADDGTYIGDIDLHSIGMQPPGQPRQAWINPFFGNKQYWNRGLEKDALAAIITHARADLGVEKLSLEIVESDRTLVEAVQELGFHLEERVEAVVNGKDILVFSLDLSQK